ncbi:MAG: hypothetical protein KDH20_12880 [Rhodocyclaceae bacterium]|nr:hypothetical protein [Rhodocyclaceae bacterium]
MAKDNVTPLRPTHESKEARLARMRDRFEQAHPATSARPKAGGSAKALLVFIAIGLLMIWLASTLAG